MNKWIDEQLQRAAQRRQQLVVLPLSGSELEYLEKRNFQIRRIGKDGQRKELFAIRRPSNVR